MTLYSQAGEDQVYLRFNLQEKYTLLYASSHRILPLYNKYQPCFLHKFILNAPNKKHRNNKQ